MRNSLFIVFLLLISIVYSQNSSIKFIEKIETIALGKLEPNKIIIINDIESYEQLKKNFRDKNNIWPKVDFNTEIFVAGFIETLVFLSQNCQDKITYKIYVNNDTCVLNFKTHHIGLAKGLWYYNFFYKITFFNKIDFKYKTSLDFINYNNMNTNNIDSICNILKNLK